jgi:hypothetical protein
MRYAAVALIRTTSMALGSMIKVRFRLIGGDKFRAAIVTENNGVFAVSRRSFDRRQ